MLSLAIMVLVPEVVEEGFLHTGKAFNVYQAKLLHTLAAIEQPTPVDPVAGVYIPKLALLPAFWKNTADALVLSIGMPLTCVKVYEKRLGGYLFHFTDPTPCQGVQVFVSM